MSGPDRLLGAAVVDAAGRSLGAVSALLVDPDGLDARWLDLTLPSGEHAVLPAEVASADAAGVLTVPYALADLVAAPRVSGPVLTAQTADALLEHYGFPREHR